MQISDREPHLDMASLLSLGMCSGELCIAIMTLLFVELVGKFRDREVSSKSLVNLSL